jgi:hypothetical protein
MIALPSIEKIFTAVFLSLQAAHAPLFVLLQCREALSWQSLKNASTAIGNNRVPWHAMGRCRSRFDKNHVRIK